MKEPYCGGGYLRIVLAADHRAGPCPLRMRGEELVPLGFRVAETSAVVNVRRSVVVCLLNCQSEQYNLKVPVQGVRRSRRALSVPICFASAAYLGSFQATAARRSSGTSGFGEKPEICS
jgi:hypothetical protein